MIFFDFLFYLWMKDPQNCRSTCGERRAKLSVHKILLAWKVSKMKAEGKASYISTALTMTLGTVCCSGKCPHSD